MRHLLPVLLLVLNLHGAAQDFSTVIAARKRYTVCRVDLAKHPLELFWRDEAGVPFKTFDAVERSLETHGRTLTFGMNAGMYHGDLNPVGLFVSGGKELRPLNLENGGGNFFLKPNGIFAITQAGARVIESSTYPAFAKTTLLATQSGPLLVLDGRIHPAFNPASGSRLFRNGVGVVSPQEVVFAISEEVVNFHEFAALFRDTLHCGNALFLDGTISSLYSTELKRNNRLMDLGTIIGTTEAKADAATTRPTQP